MASRRLDILLPELLSKICSFLDRPSLIAFATANKQCLSIASTHLHQTIWITCPEPGSFSQPLSLNEQVEKLRLSFNLASSFQHVYRMNIVDEDKEVELRHHTDLLFDASDNIGWPLASGNPSEWNGDQTWIPLADLICDLPALRDLSHLSRYQLAPCVLAALHTQRRKCRLRMHNLYCNSFGTKNVDLQQYAIATSPLLYGVTLKSFFSFDWNSNRQMAFLMEFLEALNPHLRELKVMNELMKLDDEVSWKAPSELGEKRLELESLELWGEGLTNRKAVDVWWTKVCGFSKLRTLRLRAACLSGLEFLAEQQRVCDPFVSLTALSIGVKAPYCLYSDETHASFIRSLPPLKAIKIAEEMGPETFRAVLERYGASIRRLGFTDLPSAPEAITFGIGEIDEMKHYCSLLEDLALPLRRSHGSKAEVALYTALGSIGTLKSLTIYLDCENASLRLDSTDPNQAEIPNHPEWDEFHQQIFAMGGTTGRSASETEEGTCPRSLHQRRIG